MTAAVDEEVYELVEVGDGSEAVDEADELPALKPVASGLLLSPESEVEEVT